jgi:hypothetical protein
MSNDNSLERLRLVTDKARRAIEPALAPSLRIAVAFDQSRAAGEVTNKIEQPGKGAAEKSLNIGERTLTPTKLVNQPPHNPQPAPSPVPGGMSGIYGTRPIRPLTHATAQQAANTGDAPHQQEPRPAAQPTTEARLTELTRRAAAQAREKAGAATPNDQSATRLSAIVAAERGKRPDRPATRMGREIEGGRSI